MAGIPVTMHPALRAWHGAGLHALLLDEAAMQELAEATRQAVAASMAPAAEPHAASQQRAAHAGPGAPRMPYVPPDDVTPARAARSGAYGGPHEGGGADLDENPYATPQPQQQLRAGQHGTENQQRPSYAEHRAAQAAGTKPQTPSPRSTTASAVTPDVDGTMLPSAQASTLEVDQWPAQWRELLERTPAKAPLAWTYWTLGLDLCGHADARRRDLLRRLVSGLNMPRGTHAFWPIALPDEATAQAASNVATQQPSGGESDGNGDTASASPPGTTATAVANVPLYLAGLERIAPRILIIMGSQALRAVLPNMRIGPFQQGRALGRQLIVLPDLDFLTQEPARLEPVVAYLQQALAPLANR